MGTDIRALTKALEAIQKRPIAASVAVHVATLLGPQVNLSSPEDSGPTLTRLMEAVSAIMNGEDAPEIDPHSSVGVLVASFRTIHLSTARRA